jgi:hypothetical protein
VRSSRSFGNSMVMWLHFHPLTIQQAEPTRWRSHAVESEHRTVYAPPVSDGFNGVVVSPASACWGSAARMQCGSVSAGTAPWEAVDPPYFHLFTKSDRESRSVI